MAKSNGNCFVCGKTAGKTAMKNHVLKEHGEGDEKCCLVRAEGAYDKNFWLLFSMAHDASMTALDKFLRNIWCECCGHLSSFSAGFGQYGKSRKLSELSVGDSLLYEYDFGTTTEIAITIVGEISRAKQREKIQLLARNEPPAHACKKCGLPAAAVNAWEDELLCAACAGNADEDAIMPLVNSPRCGMCAYDGASDIWTFDPALPFPQHPKPKRDRNGARG